MKISRKILLLAHQRAPIGKTVLYRLVELSIKMGNFDEAADYYKNFVEISPNDNSRYILKYKLSRARRAPIKEQISILQEYKEKEYTERWSYELAKLYYQKGDMKKMPGNVQRYHSLVQRRPLCAESNGSEKPDGTAYRERKRAV